MLEHLFHNAHGERDLLFGGLASLPLLLLCLRNLRARLAARFRKVLGR